MTEIPPTHHLPPPRCGTMQPMTQRGHIVTAFGQFWWRDEIDWKPAAGGKRQLLGYRGERKPGLRFNDFRRAAGVYVLWNEHRATYVGLARGNDGLFARLSSHAGDENKEWTRFSWFTIDPVVESEAFESWCVTQPRNDSGPTPTVTELVRELEALLIMVLGTHSLWAQRQMKFINAHEWLQVCERDYAPGGLARKVDPTPLDKRNLAAWE